MLTVPEAVTAVAAAPVGEKVPVAGKTEVRTS